MNSILFEKGMIKGLEIRNRFVRSATAEGMATPDGSPTEKLMKVYCDLAEGEVGLIITSGALIEAWEQQPSSLGLLSPLCIHDDRYVDQWREITREVHDRGARIAMQIGHLGRQDIPVLRGATPIAPSPVPVGGGAVIPREMMDNDIYDIIEKFAQACRRVKEAGFDAVQFHGAHGNLINNFMSPFTNTRTDRYGGGVENRARFVVEIVRRARQLVGSEFPIMIKMNSSDFIPHGLNQEDAVKIGAIVAEAGIDCIEVSGGTLSESGERIAVKGIKKPEEEAYFRNSSKALKEKTSIPVILVGGNRTPAVMASVLEEKAADFVAMSRPLIREPGLVKRWKHGDLDKAKCVSCNQCFEKWVSNPLRCYMEKPM